MEFEYFNPNKKHKKEGDCVVRAYCAVLGKEWRDVFDELAVMARENYLMPNSRRLADKYLPKYGFIKRSLKIERGDVRPTVAEFARKHKKGRYVLNVRRHFVGVVDGKYMDTWDSGQQKLYGYWELIKS